MSYTFSKRCVIYQNQDSNERADQVFPTAKQNMSNVSRSEYNQEIHHQIRNMQNQENGNENAFIKELRPFHTPGRIMQEKGIYFFFSPTIFISRKNNVK